MARLLHFVSNQGDDGQYVVLQTELPKGEGYVANPEDVYAERGYDLEVFEIGEREWPKSLLTDQALSTGMAIERTYAPYRAHS